MKKRIECKLVVFTLLLALSFFCLISCKSETPPNEYEYLDSSFEYQEEYNLSDIYEAKKTETNYATYYFVNSITENERNIFVTHTEKILDSLSGMDWAEMEEDQWLHFYVSKDFYTRADSSQCDVYVRYSDFKKVELISYTLQAIVGETLNYGLLYGLSARIYDSLCLGKTDVKNDKDLKSFYKKTDNRYILDLTYAVFHKKFSSDSNINYAKSLSIKLVRYLDNKYEDNIYSELIDANRQLDLSFDDLFYAYLNEYLDNLGIAEKSKETVVLRYASYTSEYPIKIYSSSCEYLIHKNWEEIKINSAYLSYKNFKYNYSSLSEFLKQKESSLELVRNFFDYTGNRKPPVFLKHLSETMHGYTYIHQIELDTLFALVHEYAHFICFNIYGYTQSAFYESIAHYCDIMFGDMQSEDMEYRYRNQDKVEITEMQKQAFDKYNKVFEINNTIFSFKNYFECYLYVNIFELGNHFNLYEETYSIGLLSYLVDVYGKKKFLECYSQGGNFSVYGKTSNEIISEYKDYLNTLFD